MIELSEFGQGLYVAAAGMGLVFFSLAVIMFLIKGLERLFRVKELPQAEPSQPEPAGDTAAVPAEVVAAISIAIAQCSELAARPVGRGARSPLTLKPSPRQQSAWRAFARLQQMTTPTRERHRR